MATRKIPKRYISPLDNDNIAAGAGIETSKLAEGGDFVKKTGTVAFTGAQSMGGFKLTNLAAPTPATNDAARIVDVENAIAALNSLFDGKGSVRVATTANGALATAFENGDVIDGVTLVTGDRILLKDQTAPAENGIYVVAASGAPTRAADFDAWTEIPGGVVSVEEGTVNADTLWLSTANRGGTLNTTAITWFQIPTTASGLTGSNFVDNEVPSGTVNGSNVTFTLANTPIAGSVHLYLEGVRLYPGAGLDYTMSGATITMAVAPINPEVLLADYRK